MNEPSQEKVIRDLEKLVHALFDCLLYGKRIRFEAYGLPQSILQRIKNEMEDGKLTGYIKEGL